MYRNLVTLETLESIGNFSLSTCDLGRSSGTENHRAATTVTISAACISSSFKINFPSLSPFYGGSRQRDRNNNEKDHHRRDGVPTREEKRKRKEEKRVGEEGKEEGSEGCTMRKL